MTAGKPSKTKTPKPSCRKKRTGWRRVAFSLAAILLALLPFVLLEGVLTILDLGGQLDRQAAGFGTSRSLFELDEDEQTYTTARTRLLFFGRQEFAREKPEETFRIFGLGGSTVHGRPYENATSFLKWMEIELAGRDSQHDYETVNCGGLSYASYRLTYLLDEVLQYDPDLIVVATGHNEFLEDRTYRSEKQRPAWLRWAVDQGGRLRTVNLARQLVQGTPDEMDDLGDRTDPDPEVEARLDSESGYASYHRDDQWRRDVIDQYEQSLRELVAKCDESGVPLILVNLGDNLRDCPPFKSEHKTGLDGESLQRWQALFDEATDLDAVDPKAALVAYEKAEAIDDQHALLAFRIARCYDRLGQMQQASEYYRKARQLDICPLRMIDEMHALLKKVAGETDTPLVDAEPDQIAGNDRFMDHVHPTIGSHQKIGRMLADKAEEIGLVESNQRWTQADRRRAYRNHFRRLGPVYLANGRRRVGWLENWARHERLDEEAVPVDAQGHLRLGMKLLDFGEIDAAWREILLAMVSEPDLIDQVLTHAVTLFAQGRPDLAQEVLLRLHQESQAAEHRAAIKRAYVTIAFECGDTETAARTYARYRDEIERAGSEDHGSLDGMPDVLKELAELTVAGGEALSASQYTDPFLVRTTLSPDTVHIYSARKHLAKHDYDAALIDVTWAIELAPENVEAYKLRAILRMVQSNLEGTIDDLTTAIELKPNAPELLRLRAAARRRLGQDAQADADLKQANQLDPPTN